MKSDIYPVIRNTRAQAPFRTIGRTTITILLVLLLLSFKRMTMMMVKQTAHSSGWRSDFIRINSTILCCQRILSSGNYCVPREESLQGVDGVNGSFDGVTGNVDSFRIGSLSKSSLKSLRNPLPFISQLTLPLFPHH